MTLVDSVALHPPYDVPLIRRSPSAAPRRCARASSSFSARRQSHSRAIYALEIGIGQARGAAGGARCAPGSALAPGFECGFAFVIPALRF